jgi:hypothetical protein
LQGTASCRPEARIPKVKKIIGRLTAPSSSALGIEPGEHFVGAFGSAGVRTFSMVNW